MAVAPVDYSPQGVGNHVSFIFPNGQKETNPDAPIRSLLKFLDARVSVGVMWEEKRKVLEFFWGEELDQKKINEALNFFQSEYPASQLCFSASTTLTI